MMANTEVTALTDLHFWDTFSREGLFVPQCAECELCSRCSMGHNATFRSNFIKCPDRISDCVFCPPEPEDIEEVEKDLAENAHLFDPDEIEEARATIKRLRLKKGK